MAPFQALFWCRPMFPGQPPPHSAELVPLDPGAGWTCSSAPHSCQTGAGFLPRPSVLRRLRHGQRPGTEPCPRCSSCSLAGRRMRPGSRGVEISVPADGGGGRLILGVLLCFPGSRAGREPPGSLAAPGAGDGAGAPRFFAILLQQVAQPVGHRLPHLDGGAVSTRRECSLDSQMFVNSKAGINKLGLISTALPEVCTDSRGAGREGRRPRA